MDNEQNQNKDARIIDVDLQNEMRKSFLDYSMSVIVSRALPDVRDGLKPVHRRILYTMNHIGLDPSKPYHKCADTVGQVLGSYHPHGDASVYDAMVRLAQDFSMRYMLVDGHGNFGSVDGDPPAAYRYTEARMSKISLELLTDIEKNTVDFMSNYDDRLKEPTVLPSRFPNLLVNGSSGIAVGMATSIPPHNFGEVIDGVKAYMKNPDMSLMKSMHSNRRGETMFRFEKYEDSLEEQWDKFIAEKSINGTFLQSRRFFNYHPAGRFKDVSLVVYNEKNYIAALIPACELEQDGKKVFFSHKGTTFGGIIIDKKHHNAKHVVVLVEELKDYLKEQCYDEAYLKMTSDIFSEVESDLFQYAFQHAGYTEHKELSTYVNYATYKEAILSNFAQGKRTNVHNCEKEGLECRPLTTDDEIKEFYDILCENLSKYDTKPVHTLAELLDFKNDRFPEECGFFGIFKEDEMLAGSMMFYFDKVGCAHTQYLAARQAFNKLSPMTFMYYSMIVEMKNRGYKRISWGTATEDLGNYLNMGLITSKEDFGSSYCNNLTYSITLQALEDSMKVSVLVTFYNQEDYVDEALQSVFDQKCDFDFEVLIGDDGSTDGTMAKLQKWMQKYPD